jgi:TolB-like protein/tRNA A-37 threonylcarbamoyl transferase component Bud32/Tfp pilus assembly protein PilF
VVDFLETLTASLADRYAIGREIGHGGMAIVYRAEDLKHHRKVAVKVLRPELTASLATQRFLREIEIASQLLHPHILPLYDSGQAADLLYYVMPLIEGETLRDRLQREVQLSIEHAIAIAKEIAEALGYAHGRGVIHRDVKPDNILFSEGHALVADFGISRAIWSATDGPVTMDGVPLGTLEYMSPEQSEGRVDTRSDIYSLGCVLYEMLSGEPPFTGRTAHAILARHATEPVRRLSTVRPTAPESLEWVVAKALAKVPADRFASAQEFTDALTLAMTQPTDQLMRVAQRDAASRFGVFGPAGEGRAIAVLPFVNVGNDADKEYFTDGVTDEIISALTRVPGLRVAPRTSVYALRGKGLDVGALGERLRVDTVLEGSIRWAGDALKIDARLTDVGSGYNVWAGTFGRQMKDIFAIQEEISRTIVAELRLALRGRSSEPLVKRYTENVEAYRLYLRGRYFWNKRTPQGIQRALQFYLEALGQDPNYAIAHSGLADAYIALSQFQYLPSREVLPKAEMAALKAVELDDTLAEAHTSLAHIHEVYHWRWAAAEEEYLRALERDPHYAIAHAWYADYLMVTGRTEESFSRMQRAQQLEPLSVPIDFQATTLLYRARRFEEAIDGYRRIIEMEPRYYPAYVFLGFTAAKLELFDETIPVLERAIEVVGPLPGLTTSLGYLYALSGRTEKASALLDSLLATAKDGYLAPIFPVILHAVLGQKDAAFQWLAKAHEERSLLITLLQVEPYLDDLRSDRRFDALVRSVFS